ncbi:MAG: hypothetical protein QOH60_3912 [Mycobacterium sp.]|jgi:hypothetical protein|nr:hypothetical protein [Mycobacterium sp.]
MRGETSNWLKPMVKALDERDDIDIKQLMTQATMPAAEADDTFLDSLAESLTRGTWLRGFDWVRFGCLLRHELGWDDAYPAYPDFPESRDNA